MSGRRRKAVLATVAAWALASFASASADTLDTVHLVNGRKREVRVHEMYHPDHLIVIDDGKLDEIPWGDVDSSATLADTLRVRMERWLDRRKAGMTVDEEWALVAAADAAGLGSLARVQAYHVLLRDSEHEGAHEYFGHRSRGGRREWRLPYAGKGRHKDAEAYLQTCKWQDRLVLESPHYIVETNAGLRVAIDTLVDLERFYAFWMQTFGIELRLCEDVDFPERDKEKMDVFVYAHPDDGTNWVVPKMADPMYYPGSGYTTRSVNVAHTHLGDGLTRPLRLFDVATQQLMFSTMTLSRDKGRSLPHFAHWAEIGLGYWMELQFGGPVGYAEPRSLVIDKQLVEAAYPKARSGPLPMASNEVTNLIGLDFQDFYGTSETETMHRAKSRSFVSYLLQAIQPMTVRGKERVAPRDAFLLYLREAYGKPTAHSSSVFDNALGIRNKGVETLRESWKEWMMAQRKP